MPHSDELDECIHGLGPVAACVICNGREKREKQVESPRTFPAKYASQCPECNLPIMVGSAISWLPDRPAVHAECWED